MQKGGPSRVFVWRNLRPFGKDFLAVTPGIRPSWSKNDDQSRISTPSEAMKNGSDFLVIGRPITASKNPIEALEKIYKEMYE